MKTSLRIGMVAVLAGCAMAARAQGDLALAGRNHTFYAGFGFGPTSVKPGGDTRKVEGIDFKFDTSGNDLGGAVYAGYWLNDHVALELGSRSYGTLNVPFSFSDPHDNTTGTGESEVAIRGFNVSLLVGADIGRDVQVFVRAGALQWKEDLKSRFDIPGQPAIHRTASTSGTGFVYGAGAAYRFTSTWSLVGQYEMTTLDQDNVSMASVGLSYDFVGLLRN